MAFSTVQLSKSNNTVVTGCVLTAYGGQEGILPVHRGGNSNTITSSSSGDYDGGDRVIGFPNGYEIDGDLLFTVGWGDGFAVRRLNNDGTMTKLFHDNNFLWRDTSSSYNHITSVAISTTLKKGVVMSYNVDGYTTFDYSGLVDGGTTFVKDPRPTHTNPQRFIGGAGSSGLNISSVGMPYTTGLVAAGDWVYAGEHDARHYKKYPRRNLETGVEEVLTTEDDRKVGSAIEDRSGYRYTLFYDEVNDRVFYMSFYNSNFTMVEDASTATPKLIHCDIGDTGQGDDAYETALHITDPVNFPNQMVVGGKERLLKVDITPCHTGGDPTILDSISLSNSETGVVYINYMRAGTKYQKTSGTPTDKVQGNPNHMCTSGDRGRAMIRGWVDWENLKVVAPLRPDGIKEDTTTLGRGSSYSSDYGNPTVLMSSANGTKYYIQTGYGWNGHSFKVWPENIHPNKLIGDWTAEFGTFTLANSAKVDTVFVSGLSEFQIPSNCTLAVYFSNNNGTTWEVGSIGATLSHVFTSEGSQLKIKLVATGRPDKSPYYVGNKGKLVVCYGSMHDAAKTTGMKFKIPKRRRLL